ncbi:MAG TPA: hypothetical protein VLQ65_08335, partial [Saliniramus sp.]|nr:hypothetical protein [Saliniramus sp.]
MPKSLPSAIEAIATPAISPADVITLRRHYFADDAISLREGEELFAVAAKVGDSGCREWHQFFSEAIGVLLIDQVQPHGYLSDENADWFIARIMHDGHVLLKSEFETLIRVMERAREVPDKLAAFALGLVKEVVLTGDGTSITGEKHAPGVVTAADVTTLRRTLFVASSEGFGAVSRAEADILFDIADATAGAENDPSFDDLFARAIGNHLLSGLGRHAPERKEALRREAWLDERRPLGSGIAANFRGIVFGRRKPPAEPAEAAPATEIVTSEEAAWLKTRIHYNGEFGSAERALLAFLRNEAAAIDPSLDA